MSSDTAKENASVVDSSVTEWKNEMGNLDGPGTNNSKNLHVSSIMLDDCAASEF